MDERDASEMVTAAPGTVPCSEQEEDGGSSTGSSRLVYQEGKHFPESPTKIPQLSCWARTSGMCVQASRGAGEVHGLVLVLVFWQLLS